MEVSPTAYLKMLVKVVNVALPRRYVKDSLIARQDKELQSGESQLLMIVSTSNPRKSEFWKIPFSAAADQSRQSRPVSLLRTRSLPVRCTGARVFNL